VIDMAGADLPALAAEIRAACTGPGFFYLRGHGVAPEVIALAVTAAQRFFHQPPEVKQRSRANLVHRGWHAAGGAVMEGATKPDLKEFFSIGLDLPEDHPAVLAGEKLRGPNQWPAAVPELRPAMEAYFAAMARCGANLLEAVALSLDLPQNFFAPHYTLPLQRTQAIFYPPQPPDDHEGFGVAPHTDFGCITLLWQDDSGGLEVRERSTGEWIPAPPLPDTLVVNVGTCWAAGAMTASPAHRTAWSTALAMSGFPSPPSMTRIFRPQSTHGRWGRPSHATNPPPVARISSAGSRRLSPIERAPDEPPPPQRACHPQPAWADPEREALVYRGAAAHAHEQPR